MLVYLGPCECTEKSCIIQRCNRAELPRNGCCSCNISASCFPEGLFFDIVGCHDCWLLSVSANLDGHVGNVYAACVAFYSHVTKVLYADQVGLPVMKDEVNGWFSFMAVE